MQALIRPLSELAEYEEIRKHRRDNPGVIQITGCVNSQKTHMMYALSDGCKYKVIVCSGEMRAKQVYEEYHFLDNNTFYLSGKRFSVLSGRPSWKRAFETEDVGGKSADGKRRNYGGNRI